MTINYRGGMTIRAVGKQQRFEILAYTGGKLRVEESVLPVVVDLATLRAEGNVPILIDHVESEDNTLGITDQITNDGRSLRLKGRVTGADPSVVDAGLLSNSVRRVLAMAKAGHPWQASIGCRILASRKVPAGELIAVNGQRLIGPLILATEAELFETSVLATGADSRSSFTLAASAAGLLKGTAMPPTFEEFLASLMLDKATLTAEQLAAQQVVYDKLYPAEAVAEVEAESQNDTATPANPDETVQARARADLRASAVRTTQDLITEQRRAQAAETERVTAIRARCATDANIQATAIREGWSPDTAELHMLRAGARQQAPAGHSRSHEGTCTLEAIQGAMILRAGGRLDHPAFAGSRALAMDIPRWLRAGINTEQRQRAMEAAWRFRDMSLVDLAREACRLDGRELPSDRVGIIHAAFSGSSLANIFTSNINTVVLSTYESMGDTTVGWVREGEVPDFKTNDRPRMTKSAGLEKLPRGGTADHMTRGDVGESFKIARYAKQMVIDEQDMIDDTFQALRDTPIEMGEACAALRPDLVYAILLANPTLTATGRALFNSTDANLDTSSALAADKLKAAVTAIQNFQENGRNLNLQVTHLIVPNTLEFTGDNLLESSTVVIAGTAGAVTERGDRNSLRRKAISLVTDARLDNGVIDPDSGTTYAGSASTWYLAAARAHTIEVAYRRGTGQSPQIRNFTLDKGQWGLGWDCAMDIGAKALDWRGLHRSDA